MIYRNGLPALGTPISTNSDQQVYLSTLEALDFRYKNGHGIPLADYPIHFFLSFDVTSTQEASHNFIPSELTNYSISVELTFGTPLDDNVEIFS